MPYQLCAASLPAAGGHIKALNSVFTLINIALCSINIGFSTPTWPPAATVQRQKKQLSVGLVSFTNENLSTSENNAATKIII